MNPKIFWSVLAALVVFAGLVLFVMMSGLALLGYQSKQQLDQWAHERQVSAQHSRQVAQARQARRQAAKRRELLSRTLTDFQKCVDHTVIDVLPNGYRQRLDSQRRPIRCTGRVAVKPVRQLVR